MTAPNLCGVFMCRAERGRAVALIVLSLAAGSVVAGGEELGSRWERRGPVTGSPELVKARVAGDERLYAVGQRELQHSDDGGLRWSEPASFDADLVGLAADPVVDGRLYAVLYGDGPTRLGRSDDAGATFEPIVEVGYVLATTRPGRLVVSRGREGAPLLAAISERVGDALLITSGGGRRWRPASGLPADRSSARLTSLVADPTLPGRLYVAEASYGGLFTSADDGRNFTQERRGLPIDVRVSELVIDPDSGRRVLLASERNGLRQSLYWQPRPGLAWRQPSGAVPQPWQLSSMVRVRRAVWRALGTNRAGGVVLFGSGDARTWHRLVRPSPPAQSRGARLLAVGERLVVSGPDGLFVSDDDGRSWVPTTAPFRLAQLETASFDPTTTTILADAAPYAFTGWASRDGGTSWEQTELEVGELRLSGAPQPVAGVPGEYLRLAQPVSEQQYCRTGVARSTDGGGSWTVAELPPGFAHSLTLSRTDPNLVFAGIERVPQGCPQTCSLVRSRDRGVTFECLDEGIASILGFLGLWEVRLAADDTTVEVWAEGGRMASRDGGDSWEPIGPPEIQEILARGPVGSGVAYGDRGSDELVRTTDGGASWLPMAPPPVPASWWAGAALGADANTVALVGSVGSVVLSRDGGETWLDVGAELPVSVRLVYGVGFLELPEPTLFVVADAASGILARPLFLE